MEVFIILLTFCSLRVHAGGFHFKSNLGCSSAMIFICLGAISLSKIILLSNYTIICIFIILLMLVCRFAPADINNNNNITKQNRQRMKFNSLIVLCIVFLMALLIDLNNIRVLITVSSSIEVISIIPFFKGEIKNEHKRQII